MTDTRDHGYSGTQSTNTRMHPGSPREGGRAFSPLPRAMATVTLTLVLISGPVLGAFPDQGVPSTVENEWGQEAKLLAGDARPNEGAGSSVDIDGSTAVVGASPYVKDEPGRVYVYQETAGGWAQAATLSGDATVNRDFFGQSLDLEGNTLVVGAGFANTADISDAQFAGAVYVFERAGDTWTRTAKITGDDVSQGDRFGHDVALDGDRLVVGTPYTDLGSDVDQVGAVYVFERSGTGWTQTAKLVPPAPYEDRHRFGFSVDVDGERILVGVYGDDHRAFSGGTAYVFELTGDGWEQTARLWPSNPSSFNWFGWSTDLEGDTAVVGAPLGDPQVYVFELQGTSWVEEAILATEDPQSSFGWDVALEGDRLIAGDPGYRPLHDVWGLAGASLPLTPGAGGALVYEDNDGEWTRVTALQADDRETMVTRPLEETGSVERSLKEGGLPPAYWDADALGSGVALDGDHVLAGAPGDDTDAGDETGSAYVFTPQQGPLGLPSDVPAVTGDRGPAS